MIPLLKKRAEAEKKKAAKGVTLQKRATDAGLPDWKALALFNWGTVEPAEETRALFETIGWEIRPYYSLYRWRPRNLFSNRKGVN